MSENSIELDYSKYVVENNLALVMAEIDADLTGKYYSIIHHEHVNHRGKDKYGRYKSCTDTIIYREYDTEEELKQHMIGLAESIDDANSFDTIKSGEIPEQIRNTKKAVAQSL